MAEDNERDAFAGSYFVQDRVEFGKFSVTPAFRYEDIDYERRNNLGGGRLPQAAVRRRGERLSQFIPGISVGYDPGNRISFFAGVHRGLRPAARRGLHRQ